MAGVFGKYQMLTRIASGGMAEVWLARSSSIGGFEKLLAIKRMHTRLSRNQAFVSMFIDEAKLTVSLSHPNIVQVFDFGRVDDDYFMAMEYVEGFDLATLAKRARKQERALPVDMSVFVMRAVYEGLAYAHTRGDRQGKLGIIHRDVSPQNVLVSFDGHVKVSDFGIARAASKLEQGNKNEIFGKLAYVSPEQSRGESVGVPTDVWSAGVILHELLTNQRLFARDNDFMTIEAVNRGAIPGPATLNLEVPPELNEVVLHVLERDPEKRPRSAREVAETLGAILRRHYPGASDYRLRDVISAMWDHHLPRLVPPLNEPAEDTRAGRPPESPERTKPVGERTASEIAAVARQARGERGWPSPSAPATPAARPESSTWQLGQVLVGDLGQEVRHTEATVADTPSGKKGLLNKRIADLKQRFVDSPSLWVLVDIGRAYEEAGLARLASAAYKIAAAKFAQRGWLVQAASIYGMMMLTREVDEALKDEIKRLRSLQGMLDEDLLRAVFDDEDDTADFSEYRGIFGSSQDPVEIFAESPILSSLNAEQLAVVVQALHLRIFQAGEAIVREGDRGDSFFLIGRGRVVVSADNFAGSKIYMTSLADGDCFGEHGFFTGEPRNASVEAFEEVWVLEVSKEVLNRLIQEFPTVRESLRRFYKERIAESLLAKSPLFGQLSISARKMLAERFIFESYSRGDLIIREGDQSDAFYAIKAGKVAVYTGSEEQPIPLAELGPGEIFGEIAAIEGSQRTANVRAADDAEILRLEAGELNALLARHIDIRRMIEEKIATRSEDRLRKIIEST